MKMLVPTIGIESAAAHRLVIKPEPPGALNNGHTDKQSQYN